MSTPNFSDASSTAALAISSLVVLSVVFAVSVITKNYRDVWNPNHTLAH